MWNRSTSLSISLCFFFFSLFSETNKPGKTDNSIKWGNRPITPSVSLNSVLNTICGISSDQPPNFVPWLPFRYRRILNSSHHWSPFFAVYLYLSLHGNVYFLILGGAWLLKTIFSRCKFCLVKELKLGFGPGMVQIRTQIFGPVFGVRIFNFSLDTKLKIKINLNSRKLVYGQDLWF